MAMANEMGTRRQQSSIMTARPTSPSITGGSLESPALDDLVEMDHAREGEGHRHEVHEGAVHDAEHVGGVPIGPDPVGLAPHQPGEEEHEAGVHALDGALEPALPAGTEQAVDEVHDGVLVGEGDEGESREDQHEQHELGDLEGAPQRPAEDVARHHVHHREGHHGEENRGGDHAEERVGVVLPLRVGRAHFPAATFFSSSRNSASTLGASTPLALALVIQSSTMGAERFLTSATSSGLALTIFTPDFFSASMPFRSASSHEAPARRAMCSPEIFAMAS